MAEDCDASCSDPEEREVNHAITIVVYGKSDRIECDDYWLVKNSWGVEWGDAGFFKIQRGVNMCGVAVCNAFPNDVVKLSEKSNEITFLQ